MKEKPEIGKSILFGIIALVAFWLCFLVVGLALVLLMSLIEMIPILSALVEGIFRARGDSPSILSTLIAAGLAYSATNWMISRFCDNKSTESLSHYIGGALIVAASIALLILNIISDVSLFPNIVTAIAGIVFIISGKSDQP